MNVVALIYRDKKGKLGVGVPDVVKDGHIIAIPIPEKSLKEVEHTLKDLIDAVKYGNTKTKDSS